MRETEVLEVLKTRAQRHARSARLEVDYYRIRRRIAFPWPMEHLPDVHFAVALANYPWHIWLAWEIEERIQALGWAGEMTGDEAFRRRCGEDLASLARWPSHSNADAPDLVLGHLLRTMILAARNWSWVPDAVRADIKSACQRAIEAKRAWLDENLDEVTSVDQVLRTASPARERVTQNIPLIGTIGLAMAAMTAQHPAATALSARVNNLISARMQMLEEGVTEGVAYDGYVLDFFADWLSILGAEQRQALLHHPGVEQVLSMGVDLAAPGRVLNVANLSDVEPREMPFHASAHAKLARMRPLPHSAWYLAHAEAAWLRSDALAAVQCLSAENAPAPSPASPVAGPYTVTLRTGWEPTDVAVAIGSGRSPMSHIHHDGGSVMIAHRGHWLIADPGYQQYLRKQERVFTIGPQSHNAPLINGAAQTARKVRVVPAKEDGRQITLDLFTCYGPDARCTGAWRTVWLLDSGTVVIADRIAGREVERIQYNWHGLPEAAWWVESGRAILHHDGASLWIGSHPAPIRAEAIDRLPGSRGHLTLQSEMPGSGDDETVCWWVFNPGDRPVDFAVEASTLTLEGRKLTAL